MTASTARKAELSRHYRKQKAYGRPTTDLVDAEPARQHVNMLRMTGLSEARIAAAAGIPDHALRSLLHSMNGRPPVKRIRKPTADAILGVPADPTLKFRRDPRGTQRRIQALAVQGWSQAELGRRLGMAPQNVGSILTATWVTPATHERFRELFDALWNVEPPASTPGERKSVAYVKALARRNKWVSPLGWDDIDNDSRPPRPGVVGGVRAREEEVRRLHQFRLSDKAIGERVGVNERTVLEIRKRLGLPAWTKEQQEAA